MAEENRDWGYRRIQGALANLGHVLAPNTIASILRQHGIEPAPDVAKRRLGRSSLTCIGIRLSRVTSSRSKWTASGLQRFFVLFFMELSTRRVQIGGIANQANGLWMVQIARNLTDSIDGFFKGKRYLIHDRDPLYTQEFLGMLTEVGIEAVKLPPRSPNLNAYAERFVKTIKEGCLERMILFGEDSLRNAVHHFVEHYDYAS
jgi:putative transposase